MRGSYSGRTIGIPIEISLDPVFRRYVGQNVMNNFAIVVRMTTAPAPNPFRGGIAPARTDSASVILGQVANSSTTTVLHRLSISPAWLRTDVSRIEVSVVPFSGLTRDGSSRPYVTRHAMSFRLVRRLESWNGVVRPYLVPIALIGRPPGDRSYATLTSTSRVGATMRMHEGQSESSSSHERAGFGPITLFSGPTYTSSRSERSEEFNTLHFAYQQAWRSHPAQFGPGLDDVMICLKYPTILQYRSILDGDYRIEPGQATFVSFPMRALITPGLVPEVDRLRPEERRALMALNPLLLDPGAQLPEPRFVRINGYSSAGPVSGALQAAEINGALQAMINRRGVTSRSSSSFSLPIGAVLSAVGGPSIGSLVDPFYRSEETTTIEMEYGIDHEQVVSNELGLQFHLEDSNPTRVLRVEVYYDTYFRTFLFRDLSGSRRPRLLWSRDDGSSSLWDLDRLDQYLAHRSLSRPAAGGRARSYQRLSDGTACLLWSAPGVATVQLFDARDGVVGARQFVLAGHQPISYRRSGDGTARLLWSNESNGAAVLWRLDRYGRTAATLRYGPYSEWRVTGYQRLADGSARQATGHRVFNDGTSRLIWSSPASGWSAVRTLDGRGNVVQTRWLVGTYGWTAFDYDGDSR